MAIKKRTDQPYDWEQEYPELAYPKAGHVRIITALLSETTHPIAQVSEHSEPERSDAQG